MIKRYLAQRKWQVAAAAALSTAGAALSIALLRYLNRLAGEGFREPPSAVALRALGLVALTFAANAAAGRALARFGSSAVADVRRELCERYLRLDYERLLAVGKHQVSGSLVADVGRIATLFTVLPLFFFNAATVLLCLAYLGAISPKLFAVFAAFMAFAVGSCLRLMGRTGRAFAAIRDEEDELFEHFNGLAEGKKELTLNRARARHFAGVIAASVEKNRALGYSLQKLWNYGGAWSSAMIFGAVFAVVFAANAGLGEPPVTVLQFVVVTLFLMNPLNYLIVASQDIAQGVTSVRKLDAMGVDAPPPADHGAEPPRWSTIAARRLRYDYQSGGERGFAFGPIDLTLRRGETVFVVGGNGSGKSTFALLLAGLLRPSSGHLEVDGDRLADRALPAYRELFSGVFFDFYLFGHVIDRHGRPAPDAAVDALLRKLGLEGKVKAERGELSTRDLSQGQRRRLALAQSYVDDGEIFLFDEWAADQDPEFKRYFYFELLPELKRRGKTVVAITHDDAYFGCADRVLKLEQGKLDGEAHRAADVAEAHVA